MIRFFRQIRRRLLADYKVTRYLLYALGEIVLVVIGILLALQIDAWNEERVTRQREIKFLGELRSNLERNMEVFRDFETNQGRLVDNMTRLIVLKESGIPFNDSLAPYFEGISWLEQVNIVKSAYETLKTSGLELISSDSLRLQVVDLHEVSYAQHKEVVKDVGLALFTTRVQPFNRENPEASDQYKNPGYIQYLRGRIGWKNDIRYGNGLQRERTRYLIDAIDAELARFSP